MALLWCLVLLSLIVIGVLHTSRLDLLIVRNHGDRIQARYLALAGIEKAKALLYQDARERSRTRQSHTGRLNDDPTDFREVPLGRGTFTVFHRAPANEGGHTRYGVTDEEALLNINQASAEELARIPDLYPETIAAILDWRDPDQTLSAGGAESEYYASLQPPRRPRNGPFETVRELLMVRGVTPQDFFGPPPMANEDPPTSSMTEGPDAPPLPPTGWARLLTANSGIDNLSAAGDERVNVQTADEAALTSLHGLTADIARAIIAHRGQNQIETLADLLEVRAAPPPGASPTPVPVPGNPSVPVPGLPIPPGSAPGNPNPAPSGPPVIDQDLLIELADDLTTTDDPELPGVINLNTADVDVLACLPGIDRPLAHDIIAYRSSSGFFPNTAALLRVPGVARDLYKQVAPRLTTRSETFRILSEGRIRSTGVRQRIETIVHVGLQELTTLAYREDDL